ncbi:hypothetical protein HOD20_06690, partial [archaeon]|nr:hypothetical protein [archaeon]
DDSDGYTIYQWAANEGYSYSGQVYATRDTSTVSWADIECAAATNKTVEDIALDLNSDNSDSVNRTFSVQVHSNFTVAGNLITENCSFATATWINDTVNTLSVTSVKYQEVLLWEGSHLVYATFVENDYSAYRNDSTYDFQMIVPVNGTVSSPDIAYYFYLEMS